MEKFGAALLVGFTLAGLAVLGLTLMHVKNGHWDTAWWTLKFAGGLLAAPAGLLLGVWLGEKRDEAKRRAEGGGNG